VTDAQGRFEIGDVAPGSRIAVYINKLGYAGVWSARVEVPEHGNVQLPNLVLKKATRGLTGQVLCPKGQPVVGARVFVHDLAPIETTTDANGRFHLQAVPEMAKALMVDAQDYETAEKEITAGMREITIRLPAE